MAKRAGFPIFPTGGRGGRKKVVGLLVLVLVGIAVVKDPVGSAQAVRDLFDRLSSFVDSLAG